MKDSFTIRYAVQLWLATMGVPTPVGYVVGLIAAHFLGDLVDKGLIKIDITIDKLREALKDPEWRDAALKAYNHAQAKVYTEAEKNEIRKEYHKALDRYTNSFRVSDK